MEGIKIKIQIDGKNYEVKPKKNLLETCLALGLDIPHFCYHPALGSVGACRLCAVKKFRDSDDKTGRIVMSCMEPVAEGLIISIEDEEVKTFRAAVIEGLMTNHPHDCPVCDEGGECHLQDMTVMSGHNYRKFDFKKRTYTNQNLGPFISHEMNRCIQCYRCVRFYRDYAGGKDLNVFSAHDHVYFGRHQDGTLENEFSGNLVEVCPTGVFTDKTLKKHYTRKWDLSNAPSVCVHCSIGCNTIASERYDSLRRIMSRYNGAVNGYFLCDRGRFGYEFVNNEKRIRKPNIRLFKNGIQEEAGNEILQTSLSTSLSDNQKIIGIGSPRASLEANFALYKLVGKDNFYQGISKKEQSLTNSILNYLKQSGVQTPSLKQIEKADAILILGEDLVNTAPMAALAVRQSVRNASYEEADKHGIPIWNDAPVRELAQELKSPVYIATPFKDSLDDIAEDSFRASYSAIANLGFAIASILDEKAPVFRLFESDLQELAEKIAHSLKTAKNPLIISGIHCGSEDILHAAYNITTALISSGKNTMLSMDFPECNSMGLAHLPGNSLEDVFILADTENIDTVVILENDLYRRASDVSVDYFLNKCKRIIVLDQLINKTTLKADIVIPSATFAESEGTLVNNEGRAQRYYKAIVNKDEVKESWKWINEFIKLKNGIQTDTWKNFDDIVSDLINEWPVFLKLKNYLPATDYLMQNVKITRQTMRYSGRTAMNANKSVSETGIPKDNDSPLTFSMEGKSELPPSSLVPFYWTPGWNSVQAMYNYLDEPNGSMKGGDPGVRLIETNDKSEIKYYEVNIQPNDIQKDELLVVPVYQIFGSEELSAESASVAQRIPEPFVYLNQKDADILNILNDDFVQLEFSKTKLKIKVKIENSIVQGVAGLSVNLPGMQFIELPEHARFNKL